MFGNASVYSSAKNDRPVGPKYSHNAYKIYFFAAEVLTLGWKNFRKLHRNANRFCYFILKINETYKIPLKNHSRLYAAQ